jgi:hypothetical protein
VHVLPRLVLGLLAGVKCEAVADRPHVRDVRERERLISERERADVVPAREVLRADDCDAARGEDASDLSNEVVEPHHVLDYLVRMNDVEEVVLERPQFLDVSRPHIEAAPPGELGTFVDELQPVHPMGRHTDSATHLVRPRAVVAADVQYDSRRIRL